MLSVCRPVRSFLLLCILVSLLETRTNSFLLDDPKVDCPNPATNCLDNTYNRVIANLGCLGCQSGCQPGYIMTANPGYFITGNDTSGLYSYQGISIPKSKNVSEPQWLCALGSNCPIGYFRSKIGVKDSCAYCGNGCSTCQSFDNCEECILGYWVTRSISAGGGNVSTCTSSGVLCPTPSDGWHCKHQVYARAVVGCSGCVICEDGYMPTSNPKYRRSADKVTGGYSYKDLQISGSIEISEPRYKCVKGSTCPKGWHSVTRNRFVLCEEDTSTAA